MQQNTHKQLTNDPHQKQLIQRPHEDNIRKHLLKSTINKKETIVKEIETGYSDTAISSDESSDCCSEINLDNPTNLGGDCWVYQI